MHRFTARAAAVRTGLLVTSATLALVAVPAIAQDRPVGSEESPYAASTLSIADAMLAPQDRLTPLPGREDPQIAINDRFTPDQARDPVNINGVGQIIVDSGGGFIGTCTATLINPRTVIFAAHCVNTRAATAYGANSGGTAIGIGFETNTRANAPGQPDELLNWLTGGSTGPGRFQSNRAQQFFNMNQVFYDPRSLDPASCTAPGSCFLEADIATGVLDTPTRDIPTWTMLFSPLATPATIGTATGTGYHVGITGYGSTGTGTTGSVTTGGFRRRVAENVLGGLTSLNDRNLFLFGTAGTPSRPQLLYWIDFDDPARGTLAANSRDFNGFRDNALPREGTTGPGDSGGPLILDTTFSRQTIIGVLSGGSTFFAGQPGGSYGTQSFYQPLFLYWDWIIANNPYRYAAGLAGARNWEDPSSWVSTLDPAYQIIANGQLVNGLPTELGGTTVARTPQFGELCFQSPTSVVPPTNNECRNLATGAPRNNVPNGSVESAPAAIMAVTDVSQPDGTGVSAATGGAAGGLLDGAVETALAAPGFRDGPLPVLDLTSGRPGATNFVPNNVEPARATGGSARYFDVTLSAVGNMTLGSAVTIDRFTVAGAQSQLTLNAGATLNSLIDFNQVTGIIANNGTINSGGDYFFMSGLLTGTGRVNAPFVTSVLGNFAPGTLGTIGTLTIGGNLVMASGSTLAIDVGPGGTSDRLAVVTTTAAGVTPANGTANLGGRVIFTPTAGTTIRFNDTFTILTAQGGRTGTFSAPAALSAILTPELSYTANAVTARIVAGSYFSAISSSSSVQRGYAQLLDQNRSSGQFTGLYDVLDLQNAATIQSTLEGLAPRTETLKTAVGIAGTDNMSRVVRDRLADLSPSSMGGGVAYIGRPIQTAALAANSFAGASMSDVAQDVGGSGDTMVREGQLPDTMSGFIAGGYLDGSSLQMAGVGPVGGRDRFDGYYLAGGIEAAINDTAAIGFALSYTDIKGRTTFGGQTADGELIQGTLYGKSMLGGFTLDAQVSAGVLKTNTSRTVAIVANNFTLRGKDDALAFSSEVGLGKMFGDTIQFGPRIAMRASHIGFSRTAETGGGPALAIDRDAYQSLQGRAGLVLRGGTSIRPYASATYVHDFLERPASFGANFVGGIGPNAAFALVGNDRHWGEISGGIAIDTGNITFSVGADTTIERKDVENQSYRGSIKVRF